DKFLQTGDLEWPAQLPMTKSAVRGMDATQEYLASEQGGNVPIKRFVVSGASKRGWTTWLTGVVDDRVAAIAPIVIDVLNVNVSMRHHYSAYGFWAPAIDDYVRHRITERRFLPQYRELLQIVDPFAYRDRLTMPKCIINATGDQFFLPDSSQFYFAELSGEKHLCYVPNADHSLRETNAIETLASFTYCVARGIERPNVTWKYTDPNTIVAKADREPSKVVMWSCDNPSTRDFRVETIGKNYRPEALQAGENGEYAIHVETPGQGWRAYFLEFTFDVGAPTPLRFTTPVQVVPVDLPYSSKEPPVWEKNAG
ncbi:MAG: PhoPQ-activated pathogenicity, partial [Planctomycetales bacterium]|nr:PhoPQ-activated pathogenicity [Planctomycetales bacterium]